MACRSPRALAKACGPGASRSLTWTCSCVSTVLRTPCCAYHLSSSTSRWLGQSMMVAEPTVWLMLTTATKGNSHHESSSNGILTQAANASGVRIVLSSDTDKLRMVVRPRFIYTGTDFDLVADGKLLATQAFKPQKTPTLPEGLEPNTPPAFQAMMAQMVEMSSETAEPVVVEFNDIAGAGASAAQTLELWLPHRATVTIMSLEVSAGSVVAPVKDTRPRWITHGSSITHCAEAHSPARTWPATAARLADVNLYSLGFGGQCHFDQAVARYERKRPVARRFSVS